MPNAKFQMPNEGSLKFDIRHLEFSEVTGQGPARSAELWRLDMIDAFVGLIIANIVAYLRAMSHI